MSKTHLRKWNESPWMYPTERTVLQFLMRCLVTKSRKAAIHSRFANLEIVTHSRR
jgi:hypothetical protein